MTTSRDLLLLLVAAGALLPVLLVVYRLRRVLRGLLTPREWRVYFKLIAIGLFLLLLLLTSITREFPAEMFIYGRF